MEQQKKNKTSSILIKLSVIELWRETVTMIHLHSICELFLSFLTSWSVEREIQPSWVQLGSSGFDKKTSKVKELK